MHKFYYKKASSTTETDQLGYAQLVPSCFA